MFCPKCGKEIKGGKFCVYCGCKIEPEVQKEENQSVENSKSNENGKMKINRKWCYAIATILALIILVPLLRKTPSITEDEVLQLINAYGYNSYEMKQAMCYAEVESLDNFESSWDKDNEQMTIAFDMYMENEEVYVAKQCYAILSRDKEEWWVERWDASVSDISPKQGVVSRTEEELQNIVQSFYPEINWGYTYDSVFQADIDYDYAIDIQVVSRETKLDEKIDVISYEFNFRTNTAVFAGAFTEHYKFVDGLGWTYLYTEETVSEPEWDLKGMWSLDIYTYYVDIYIKEMLWDEQIAVIEARGSSFQGSGTPDTYNIPFTVSDEGIFFSSFMLKKEITLIARYDDMYYLIPNIFTNQDPVEKATGGKSQ